MRVWSVLALLLLAGPAQGQLYSGWVDLINDGQNDQQGELGSNVLRDPTADIRGIDLLEEPDALRLRIQTQNGFGQLNQGSDHEAVVTFLLMAPFSTPVLQHEIRLKVTAAGAHWYRDGQDMGTPDDFDEADQPWNFDVSIPKAELMPEDKLRPRDHLMFPTAWLNATGQFGRTTDRAPDDGSGDTVELAGGLALPAWENANGHEGTIAFDTTSHGDNMHIAYAASSPEAGVYHRLFGSNVDTFIGPMIMEDAELFSTHVRIDADDSGSLHVLHPTAAGPNATYRYFSFSEGAWKPEEVTKSGGAWNVVTGKDNWSDLVAGSGRVVAALPAAGGIHIVERQDDGWVELKGIAGASWPTLQMDSTGDVWVTFAADGTLQAAKESQGWSPLPISESLRTPQEQQGESSVQQNRHPAYAFALRPDDEPAWTWLEVVEGEGVGGVDLVWQYLVIQDNILLKEEIPFNRNAEHADMAFDAYGNAHIALGSNAPANYLLRTIHGHWYRGPDAGIQGPAVAASASGHAGLVGGTGGDGALSVQWWPESPIYEGFAPRYDPDLGLELGEEHNGTANATTTPKPSKDSPLPAFAAPVAAGLVAWLRRRHT